MCLRRTIYLLAFAVRAHTPRPFRPVPLLTLPTLPTPSRLSRSWPLTGGEPELPKPSRSRRSRASLTDDDDRRWGRKCIIRPTGSHWGAPAEFNRSPGIYCALSSHIKQCAPASLPLRSFNLCHEGHHIVPTSAIYSRAYSIHIKYPRIRLAGPLNSTSPHRDVFLLTYRQGRHPSRLTMKILISWSWPS